MSAARIFGIVLVIAGALALGLGGFTYTKDTHTAKLGPIKLSVAETETVNVPMWAGVAAIVVGGLLIALPRR
jgi:TRAP-type C4-dicarboxylate transport system permease small subunit